MPLQRIEIETVIRIGYYDEKCTVVTGDPKYKRALDELIPKGAVLRRTSRVPVKWEDKMVDGDVVQGKPIEWDDATWEYECPAEWFRLPKPPKQMSDEQKKAAGERMRNMRKKNE
jgi:hypothetical protein